jgi:hypothetical protein
MAAPSLSFAELASVRAQLDHYLPRLPADCGQLRGVTAWQWIAGLNLNAHRSHRPQAASMLGLIRIGGSKSG